MSLMRRLSGVIAALVVVIGLVAIGFATTQAGFLFVGLLCAWPMLWAVSAWTFRGLRETYQLVPKSAPARPGGIRAPREARATQEQF